MTMTEALILAHQVGMNIETADALWDRCVDLGYEIALEHDTGDWTISDNQYNPTQAGLRESVSVDEIKEICQEGINHIEKFLDK